MLFRCSWIMRSISISLLNFQEGDNWVVRSVSFTGQWWKIHFSFLTDFLVYYWFINVFVVNIASQWPLTADIFSFWRVFDRLSVKLNNRCPKYNLKKKEKLCALQPMILDHPSLERFSSRQISHSDRSLELLSMIFLKQFACTIQGISTLCLMGYHHRLCRYITPSTFSDSALSIFSLFGENLMRMQISPTEKE